MKCYLPWRGELGWMIMCFVKKFHADPSLDKIICCKPGHECLFPSASHFFYDWQDIPDSQKAGVAQVTDEESIKEKVIAQFTKDIEFIPLSEVGWHNKHSFAQHTFIPQPKNVLDFKVDVVITPRHRQIDVLRNWNCANWQVIINELAKRNITVGVCGTKDTSCQLQHVLHKSYDHIDIDSDVEMMNNAKIVVTQESGLQYLSFLCKRPTICVGHYHGDMGADLHRDTNVFFKNPSADPMLVVRDVLAYLESLK